MKAIHYHKSHARNHDQLEAEMRKISVQYPDSWFAFHSVFGTVAICEYDAHPTSNYGEDCYREFGGFFKYGQIIQPQRAWLKRFHFIPCER